MPREGHDPSALTSGRVRQISIHVPREGHDLSDYDIVFGWTLISIHVPREGHDPA